MFAENCEISQISGAPRAITIVFWGLEAVHGDV